jgi:hypothetical protein
LNCYRLREFFSVDQKEMDFRIVFAYSGKVQVELVQAPVGDNLYQQHLAQSGEGMHHLGFFLSDLDRRIANLRQIDLPVLLEGRLELAGGSRARRLHDTRAV